MRRSGKQGAEKIRRRLSEKTAPDGGNFDREMINDSRIRSHSSRQDRNFKLVDPFSNQFKPWSDGPTPTVGYSGQNYLQTYAVRSHFRHHAVTNLP
jgi:hypothetical protein